MAIKAYSYAKDGNRKLSANFAVKEFRCKDGSDPIFIDDELVTLLQKIRDHFGKSVTITSAYRTAASAVTTRPTTMKMQASHSGNAIRKTFRMFSILFSSYFQLTHRLFAARVSICTQPAGRPAFTG